MPPGLTTESFGGNPWPSGTTYTGSTAGNYVLVNDYNYSTFEFPPGDFVRKFYGELLTQSEWEKRVNEASRKGIEELPEPVLPKSPVIAARLFHRNQPRWSARRWRSTT